MSLVLAMFAVFVILAVFTPTFIVLVLLGNDLKKHNNDIQNIISFRYWKKYFFDINKNVSNHKTVISPNTFLGNFLSSRFLQINP